MINSSVWISDQFSMKFEPNTPMDPNDIPDTEFFQNAGTLV